MHVEDGWEIMCSKTVDSLLSSMRDVKNRDFHQASHIQSSVLLVLNKYNQYSRESAVGVSRVAYGVCQSGHAHAAVAVKICTLDVLASVRSINPIANIAVNAPM